MNEVILAFLMGGAIIGSTNFAAAFFGPEYASLIGGVPTGFITPFFLNSRKQKKNFFWGYFLNAIGMGFCIMELYILIHHTTLSGYKIATIAWLTFMVLAPIFIFFFGKRGW